MQTYFGALVYKASINTEVLGGDGWLAEVLRRGVHPAIPWRSEVMSALAV